MAFKFQGGVKVHHEKHRTENKPIEKLPLPKVLFVHVAQHLGAPAEPVVKAGDLVLKGQMIAKATAYVSAPIHAPTSGKVREVGPSPHPVTGKGTAIIIETDGLDAWAEGLPTNRDWKALSPDEIRNLVKEAGIVGLGGAGFPTHVKITPPAGTVIEDLLINGAECEPYLTSDDRVMRERAADLAVGIEILNKAVGAKNIAVGIENNKPEAIAAVRKAVEHIPNCKVVELPSKYPQGAERSLIMALTGKWLQGGKLPASVGVVVQNSTTCVAVADAVVRGIPILEKVITVSGESIKEPKNVLAPVGTPWRDILDFCGGVKDDLARLVMGGPMMGLAQNSFDLPVVKGTSGLLALSKNEARVEEEGPCIRCGGCVTVCPMGLEPLQWPTLASRRMTKEAMEAHVMECVECGTCEYGCPAYRHVLQSVKVLKTRVRELQSKTAAKKA